MNPKLTSTLLLSLTGATAVASLASCKGKKETVEKKPMNIVYIMCDDHSFQTISAYDQRYIQTPNIDRIANEAAPSPSFPGRCVSQTASLPDIWHARSAPD